MSYKHLFTRALAADPDRLHFAAHSHHLWPDASHAGQARAWDDAAAMADEKWRYVFEELWPMAQARVAARLGAPEPMSIAFAQNTHDFLVRLMSCIEARPARVLLTDAEFHSAKRQFARWAEAGRVTLDIVPAEPFEDFPGRFVAAAARGGHDMVLFSHVFFDSGYVVPDLSALVRAVPADDTLVVIDGYHAFNALPVDISEVAARAFYIVGGYKYAMAGEGCCALVCPPGYGARPVVTGWFAGFDELETFGFDSKIGYPEDGRRFLGATLDPTALYRLEAVLDTLDSEGLDPASIHAWVRGLQTRFLSGLPAEGATLSLANLLPGADAPDRGHFLCFRLPNAGEAHVRLRARGVITDYRRDRLRLGFGVYHDPGDVDALLVRCGEAGLCG